MNGTTKTRLLAKIKVNADTGCWEWQGATDGKYGLLAVNNKAEKAHRVSFQIFKGPIPPEHSDICHVCDNPRCVNPDHLFSGTRKDNIQDCISKDRRGCNKGRLNPSVKLSEEQVRSIRNTEGISQPSLGKMYGVSKTQIRRIQRGESWGTVE